MHSLTYFFSNHCCLFFRSLGWRSGLDKVNASASKAEGENTHAAGDLTPQPHLVPTDSQSQSTRNHRGWSPEMQHCTSIQGGSLQTQQQTHAQTRRYYLLLLLEIIMSDNYIYYLCFVFPATPTSILFHPESWECWTPWGNTVGVLKRGISKAVMTFVGAWILFVSTRKL